MSLSRWLLLLVAAFTGPSLATAADTDAPAPNPSLALRDSASLRLPDPNAEDLPVFASGASSNLRAGQDVELQGDAEVRRRDVVLKGARINYDQENEVLDAEGNVRLLRDGNLLTGPRLRLDLSDDTGEVENPEFYVALTNGRGSAERAELLGRQNLRLHQARYSGCPCPDPDWWITASQVDLDFNENEGVARRGVVYFKGVPILASPILSFPLTDARKSGFLPPTFGMTSRSGPQVTVPYYLNLAPNYDATLSTTMLTRRGALLGGEFRYLQPSYSGTVNGTWMPHDRERSTDRWYYHAEHRQDLGHGLGFDWDLERASDDDYFRDIITTGLGRASTVTLPQSVGLNWGGRYFHARLNPVRYQTLQDFDSPITPLYDVLPRFTLDGSRYNWGGFDVRLDSEYANFRRSPWISSPAGQPDESGQRASMYTSIAYPMQRSWGFVVPKVALQASHYRTGFNRTLYDHDPNRVPGLYPRLGNASRVLPLVSLDSGLIFERQTRLFNRAMTQTLEPRLYYLYVPYRDQSDLPVYDTALAGFGFSQMFSENLFSGGWDRVANANQLTAALSSAWVDDATGAERARVAVGQRIYFADQRVTLPGETPRDTQRSDFLAEVQGELTETLSAQATIQYNPYEKRLEQSALSARWDAARLATVYTSYRYRRASFQQQEQRQVSVAFQWPFTRNFYGVARLDYSVPERRYSQILGGVEYNGGCCWTARVVGQRYAVSTESANTALFLQLELTGLGSLGTNPLEALRRNIPGYRSVTPPTTPGTPFERYE